MKKISTLSFALALSFASALLVFTVSTASATAVLYDWYVDVNGNGSMPPTYQAPDINQAPSIGGAIVGVSGFDDVLYHYDFGDITVPNAIGTVTMRFNAAGNYILDSFFDIEMNEFADTFFNESGGAVNEGAADPRQSSQVLESDGDIALKIGWDFTLGANQYAVVSFAITGAAPQGFYLFQSADNSTTNVETVYLSSILNIRDNEGGGQVPEPGTMSMLGLSLLGLLGVRAKRNSKTS